MSLNEMALPPPRRQFYLLTVLFGLVFFALIFYFRNTLEDFNLPFAYAFLGVGALVFLSGRLESFVLIILIITSTVFELLEFPTLPIMIGDLYFSDVLILLLLAGRLLKCVTRRVVVIPRPQGYPILAYILVGLFSFLYATIGFHVPTNVAGVELRAIIHLALFFLVYYYVKNDAQLKSLLLGIGMVANIVAALLILQYVLGRDTSIVSGRLEILNTTGVRFSDVIRILVPGATLMLFALNTFISIYILKGLKRGRSVLLVAIALLSLGVILTFTRVYWVMILMAILFLLFLARRRAIIYPRVSFLLAGVILILAVFLQSKVLNPGVIEQAVFNRSLSILRAPANFQHDTLFMRYLESRYAWDKIKENPGLGIGLGKSYRPLIFGKIEYESTMGGTFLHNGYLATQLKMGLPGTCAFFWLMLVFFRRLIKHWKRIKNPLYQAVVLGVGVSLAGMLLHNLIASPFLTVFGISVAAVGIGIVEKIYQFEAIS